MGLTFHNKNIGKIREGVPVLALTSETYLLGHYPLLHKCYNLDL